MDDQDRSRIASSLNELGGYIRRLSLRMKQAEEVLRKAGWRYRNGKASRIAKHKGRDLFSECVWMVYEKYREKGNTFAVRRKIAKELSCFFDHPSDLDPGDGEPICNAIRNRLKRER